MSYYLPRCPNCHRKLTDYSLFEFEGNRLIVCKNCGARLTAKISWICAAILGLITILLLVLWRYSEPHYNVWFLLLIWGFLAPAIQVKFTILKIKGSRREKAKVYEKLP